MPRGGVADQGEREFLAVVPRFGTTLNDRQFDVTFADARERIAHDARLGVELCLFGQVLQLTPAAIRDSNAARLALTRSSAALVIAISAPA